MSEKGSLRKKIEEFTQFIRIKLNLSSPLNMVEVIKTLGIKCEPVNDVDYDAKLSGNEKDGYRIEYDEKQIFARQQFSIAHELGHLLLHKMNRVDTQYNGDTYYRKNGSSSQIEWEANEFAAALLMPREEFVDFCRNHVDASGEIDLNDIADKFGVSRQAARVRGSVLNLWTIRQY